MELTATATSAVRNFLFARVNLRHGQSQTEVDPVGMHSNYPRDILDWNHGGTVQPSVSMHPTPLNLPVSTESKSSILVSET